MSWWRAALSASLLVMGLQAVAAAQPAGASNPPAHTVPSPSAHVTSSQARSRSALKIAAASPKITAAPLVQDAGPSRVSRVPFGLSIEYPLMQKLLGPEPCPSHALVEFLRSLGSPTLRIGGDSQDLAGPTSAYHYQIAPSFWTTLGCLVHESGVSVVVGLNFATSPVADDLATIASAEQSIPSSALSFSLGNEPDLYGFSHILPNEPGFIVPEARPAPWTAQQYASEWATRRALLGPVPLEGPDFAGIGWRIPIAQFLTSDPPDTLTVHAYPTVACGTAGPLASPAKLLAAHASMGLVEKYAWLLEVARNVHRPAVISESNSASCGGKPGVSDTPVAGVWAARYVLSALLAGFAQVRFHNAGTSYDAFSLQAGGAITIHPLGHALLFLHRWIPVGSEIRSSSRNPRILAASISQDGHESMIVSSFSPKPLPFAITVKSKAGRVNTDSLTSGSAIEIRSSVAVRAHHAQLTLAPNTVVAIPTS